MQQNERPPPNGQVVAPVSLASRTGPTGWRLADISDQVLEQMLHRLRIASIVADRDLVHRYAERLYVDHRDRNAPAAARRPGLPAVPPTCEGDRQMSSMTWDSPPTRARVGTDNLDNQIGYSGLIAARDAVIVKVRGLGDVLVSAARAALRSVRSVLAYLHLDQLAGVLARAVRWTRARALAPVSRLGRLLTPAGAIWALTTQRGQRIAGRVLSTVLQLVETALTRGTDVLPWTLARLGRPGRWAARPVGNLAASAVLGLEGITRRVRSVIGPWISPDRLHVRLVNAVAGLVFLRELAMLLPVQVRTPLLVMTLVVAAARTGRSGAARALQGLADVMAEGAEVVQVAAGVVAGSAQTQVQVDPTESAARVTLEVPLLDDSEAAAEVEDGPPLRSTERLSTTTRRNGQHRRTGSSGRRR